jgi:glycosyltransferase involved in cell wall biosynthesis
MRVCHVIPVLDPRTGGPPPIAASLAAEQVAAGHAVTIAAFATPEADDRIRAMLAGIPGSDKVGVEYLAKLNRVRAYTAAGTGGPLRSLARGHDILHLHGVWDPIILSAARAARSAGKPYVISGHGMLEPWSLSRHPLRKRLFWAGGFGGMLLGMSALHEHRAGPYVVLGRTLPAATWVIGNGIFPGTVPGTGGVVPARESARELTKVAWEGLVARFPELGRGRVLLFLARLAEQKGVDVLIPAFAEVARRESDVTLLLAGADYGLGGAVRGLIARHGLAGRVVVAGALVGPEKDAALAWSDAFVLPSRHEGFSVAVLEAMSAGLACLITDACHFARAGEVDAAVVAAIDPGVDYAAALVPGLFRILSPDAAGLAARGRELVLREYTWRAVAGRHLEMYASVIAGVGAGGPGR